jgi:hypothetical protein
VRWNDFGDSTTDVSDYDLVFFRPDGTPAGLNGLFDQDEGDPPIEWNTAICHIRTLPLEFGVRIRQEGASVEDDVFEVLGGDGMTFEHSTDEGSAGGPGEDSASTGVITVGALSSPTSGVVASTSSRGPTRDGRTNPTLVAASCLSTFSSATCLQGTLASAAAVGGAAALYRADHPGDTPAQGREWILANAVVDRGPAGPDDAYGAGELILPSMGPRPHYRPDARIQAGSRGALVGNNVYTPTGARQNATMIGARGHEVRFTVTFQNDDNAPERFLLAGSRSAHGYQINYYLRNVAYLDIDDGRHSTAVVPPGGTLRYQIGVRVPGHPPVPGVQGVLQVISQTTLLQVDAVRFTALAAS